ncbi:MAG: CDP-diacylglycerol--glycerol-3-phosphate 3-phosphatidyltransferase [Candidatus Firestonebacteria bacterium]|nr:CDP-diacylglycerol--glycerol-3-phosphate 3-phosphatidyltransferase [Candidatus Firestonebacteria bacterium]
MNIPNHITLYRGLSAFIFMILMDSQNIIYQYIALLIFIIAAVSDLYDGKMARETGNVTNLGKTMDPLADKLLITAGLIILVQETIIPAWMVIIIIGREFVIMGLRILASYEQKIISADIHGKYKTAAQLIVIIISLTFMLFKKTMILNTNNSLENTLQSGGILGKYVYNYLLYSPYYLMLIVVIITIVSGINYFIQNKNVLKDY